MGRFGGVDVGYHHGDLFLSAGRSRTVITTSEEPRRNLTTHSEGSPLKRPPHRDGLNWPFKSARAILAMKATH